MAADEPESPAWQHGGIKVVVALLDAGVAATKSAAMTMERLSFENDTNQDAIREAGGIAPLVALLGAGADSDAARCAAGALRNLAFSIFNEVSILEGVACAGVSTAFHTPLHRKLQEISTSRLIEAEAGDNVTALERAIRHANALSLPAATIQRASERLAEINGEAALQARRVSLGLGALPLPHEFVCPITCEKMKDPVVASDGNSYERSAIATVLATRHRPPPALL